MLELKVDFGNGFSVMHDGERTYSIRSSYSSGGAIINNKKVELDKTVLFTLDGQNYMVGDATAGTKTAVTTLNATKPKTAKVLLAALIVQASSWRAFTDTRLTIVDTNPSTNQAQYAKKLKGQYAISYQLDGVEKHIHFQVVDVETVREGLGTFNRYLDTHGFPISPNPEAKFLAVQNIGAGTMDLLVYDQSGTEVKSHTLQDHGCISYAQELSSQLRKSGKVDGDIPVEQMFRALETGSLVTWDRVKKESKTINIDGILKKTAKQYYALAFKNLIAKMPEFRNSLAKVVFTGGLAFHVTLTEKEQVIFDCAINPLHDNVIGV